MYLSNDTDGEPVLTLWLSNSTQDAFSGRSSTEGEFYGYLNGGLYSNWSGSWYSSTVGSYPSNMYGTSYIRAVTLNNGGLFTYGSGSTTTPTTATASKSTSNVFAPFTMDKFGLTEYMVKPTNIPWQRDQSTKDVLSGITSYTLPNEAISPSTTNWHSGYDYSGKTNYTAWANDYLWLPSLAETGYSDTNLGMWGVSVNQRKNYDGSTTSLLGNVGSTLGSTSGYAFAFSWLRSGISYGSYGAYYLELSGALYRNSYVNFSYAVRPALHLNLKKVNDSFPDLWDDYASDSYAGGSGTETDPYQISNASELARLAVLSHASNLSGQYFKLTANIDMSDYLWTGIGVDNQLYFSGIFDGDYYTISGINTYSKDVLGIFRYVGSGGVIKNLIVKDCTLNILKVSLGVTIGGLAANVYSATITNCIIDNVDINFLCEVTSQCYVGGIAGIVGGSSITNCIYKNSTIHSLNNDTKCGIGALIGIGGMAKLTNCSAYGIIILGGYVSSDSLWCYMTPALSTITSSYISVRINADLYKVMYGMEQGTDWLYQEKLNGGYPIQTALLNIGSVAGNPEEVLARLKKLGFE